MSASISSWVDIDPTCDFSMQNFPFGIISTMEKKNRRCASAIGSFAIDLFVLAEVGFFDENMVDASNIFGSCTLNAFMAQESHVWRGVRKVLTNIFVSNGGEQKTKVERSKADPLVLRALIPLEQVIMHLPARIGDYTDFYSSREHATNVGIMFRGKDNALQPNWLHLPVGYHGRSSTVFVSGTDVVRPSGQLEENSEVSFGPSKNLDFELEMSFFVGGPPNPPGTPLTMQEAEDRIFGFTIMNDWSARDIQKWEYVPLGPFCAKNFATTISPWIVTTDALRPYRCSTSAGVQDDPIPLEYLRDPDYSSYDIHLQVQIQGEGMTRPETVARTNFLNMYWNAKQQLVHHSSTGCVMNPGDLLGSGTISGPTPDTYGSMLELCWKGTKEVKLGESGEVRTFLKDGDLVVMNGWCEKEGVGRVGFGECVGKVLPVGSTLVPGLAYGSWVENPQTR